MIDIYINGNKIAIKDLNLNDSLDKIRKNIFDSFLFSSDNDSNIEISEESKFTLKDILKDKNKINFISKIKTENKKNIPIPGSRFRENKGKLKIYQYQNEELNDDENRSSIGLLFVGSRGTGKTALLNTIINSIMDVQINDDFRYKIEFNPPAYDRGNLAYQVSTYSIKSHGDIPPIKIIDTWGFHNNINYINEDVCLIRNMFNELKYRFYHIVICFVINSSKSYLNTYEEYIFSRFLGLLGKDMEENFAFILTSCDGLEPEAISLLKNKNSIFNEIISNIKGNLFYKFNNKAIYSDDIDNKFTQLFWKINMDSCKEFFKKIVKMPKISLSLTNEVVKVNEYLGHLINDRYCYYCNRGKDLMESINNCFEMIKKIILKINQSKNLNANLDKEYYENKKSLNIRIQLINALKNDFINNLSECLKQKEEIINYLDKYKKIALISNNFEILKKYIDIFFDEKSRNPERNQIFDYLKKNQIEFFDNNIKSMKQFSNEFLEKEKNLKSDENCIII